VGNLRQAIAAELGIQPVIEPKAEVRRRIELLTTRPKKTVPATPFDTWWRSAAH
jgi:NAD+ synthase